MAADQSLPGPLPPVASAVLNTLLNQYEQLNRRRAVRARLVREKKDHSLYFSPHDPAPRQETNSFLLALERQGIVRLQWSRLAGRGEWLDTIELISSHADALYTLLQRTPRGEKERGLRSLLDAQRPQPGWHERFLAQMKANLAARRSVAPLVIDRPQHNADLLQALLAIARLDRPTLVRILSVQVFGNSKRLEEMQQDILRVLRRYDAENAAIYGHGSEKINWELLQAYHLERVAEYIPLAGPLILQHGDNLLDMRPFLPSMALSVDTLRRASVAACPAQYIVTVENTTSFSELLAVRPPSVLALLTGGFASPSLLALLRKIQVVRPDVPWYHWGDLDVGGLRILAHLRKHMRHVIPLGMDVGTFEAHRVHSQALTQSNRDDLLKLLSFPHLADCSALINALLQNNQKLEQEAIRAEHIVRKIEDVL